MLQHLTDAAESSSERALTQRQLEVLIDENRCLLTDLGVGHERLEKVQAIADAHGFHSKPTGAGGGGCAIVYLRDCASPLVCGVCFLSLIPSPISNARSCTTEGPRDSGLPMLCGESGM